MRPAPHGWVWSVLAGGAATMGLVLLSMLSARMFWMLLPATPFIGGMLAGWLGSLQRSRSECFFAGMVGSLLGWAAAISVLRLGDALGLSHVGGLGDQAGIFLIVTIAFLPGAGVAGGLGALVGRTLGNAR